MIIRERVKSILEKMPLSVKVVAATKKRFPNEIVEAINGGIEAIGENYVQEAEKKREEVGTLVQWHLIGHLQKNKVTRAVKIFDIIETLDSVSLGYAIDKESRKINKIMPVLIEVNSAEETGKQGIPLSEINSLIEQLLPLEGIKVVGLMTMGRLTEDPEEIRPDFRNTKVAFDRIREMYSDKLEWQYLSMGMSDTYKIAIQEGANIVRIGTAFFGQREDKEI